MFDYRRKKARKGFTLVELLIVVAILVALTASMTVSMSGSTAKAKATTIAANVDACVLAVQEYYYTTVLQNDGTELTDNAEKVVTDAIPRFADFKTGKGIVYTITGDAAGTTGVTKVQEWKLTVKFTDDPDKTAIATALSKIKGYSGVSSKETFDVILWNGKIEVSA